MTNNRQQKGYKRATKGFLLCSRRFLNDPTASLFHLEGETVLNLCVHKVAIGQIDIKW